MNRILLVVVTVLSLISCSEKDDAPETVESIESKEIKIDSSGFYDSLNVDHRIAIDDFFKIKAQNRTFNGSYLYAQNGYTITSGAYGMANYTTKDSNNIHTRFQLASGSKPFTATAILKLVEKGLLGLQDSVHMVLPEFPYHGITIEMLLSHRGGLGKYTSFTEYLMKDSAGVLTNQGILEILKDTIPTFYYPPNKKFDYSNTGYAILASIVEHITNRSFKSFVEHEIFRPLGMHSSYIFDPNADIDTNVALGYVGQRHYAPGNAYLNGVTGDKGVYSTVHDMLLFDQALYDHFLPDSLYQISISAQNPLQANGKNYGFGWRLLYPDTDSTIIYHTGWWQGFRSYFIRFPKERKTIVVLDNVKTGPFLGIKELIGLVSDEY